MHFSKEMEPRAESRLLAAFQGVLPDGGADSLNDGWGYGNGTDGCSRFLPRRMGFLE
jgi:hypothetical protein